MHNNTLEGKTALITGAARRIGAIIAETLHQAGMNVALHYRSSTVEAQHLRDRLETYRQGSVLLIRKDLLDTGASDNLVNRVIQHWGHLDLLVNNASSFYPTPLATATPAQWDELMNSNLKAPFFLAQAAAPHLRRAQGNLINMVDIHAQRPLHKHSIYCTAKAGLVMLTQALARELGPEVRVNGIAPGSILWPETGICAEDKAHILSQTILQRSGTPTDIARTLLFLVRDGGYITGQIITVDGGRSIFA